MNLGSMDFQRESQACCDSDEPLIAHPKRFYRRARRQQGLQRISNCVNGFFLFRNKGYALQHFQRKAPSVVYSSFHKEWRRGHANTTHDYWIIMWGGSQRALKMNVKNDHPQDGCWVAQRHVLSAWAVPDISRWCVLHALSLGGQRTQS